MSAPVVPDKPIIFFDGVCGLCNAFVDFVFLRDTQHRFLFASLQSQAAQRLLPKDLVTDLNTVVLWENGHIKTKSQAAIAILNQLGGGWTLVAKLSGLSPMMVSEKIYDLVAANRYQIFGRRDVCRLPTPEEKPYFLDEA